MTDLNFKKATLEDKDIISHYFNHHTGRSCERTFANIYLWSKSSPVTFAIIEDTLVFKREVEGDLAFTYPAGKIENIDKTIGILEQYSEEKGFPFKMYFVTENQFEEIEEAYPDKFQIEYVRDVADYVYEQEKLATLAGKKLHGKRNHINKFLKVNEGRWAYEPMSKENLEDCFQMNLKWCQQKGCFEDEEQTAEMMVAQNALRLFEELELTGGVIRLDGEVIAYTIGERVSSDTFVVHIEKAFADIDGAYPMINQQFVIHACEGYTYVNREDDAGVEGLRKAKLSYYPAFLLQKGEVTLKER
ncbi:hypothetical protein M2454_001827 [Aequitasia blattaphilus]|uniref:Phosphatidylglycerol lysyltransferase domain-containing protein n=1 Tax=Aequitasia blattaphilus TaxID=2949332 RepID=A0ABT1E8Z3_9FIRM|nr:phosphatidylglycerol lysyltransferase domain-containing protein [Aequitasia blattaphilus]MCP1102299.1 phosphatidylglycerol lysyltransferase domain-containing protein [Aequitasia blattaphilus]MCR8614939.1 phosphatidylglycerol lysyltransferase domain-containing protein [Aequitasia blattaphilus]